MCGMFHLWNWPKLYKYFNFDNDIYNPLMMNSCDIDIPGVKKKILQTSGNKRKHCSYTLRHTHAHTLVLE